VWSGMAVQRLLIIRNSVIDQYDFEPDSHDFVMEWVLRHEFEHVYVDQCRLNHQKGRIAK